MLYKVETIDSLGFLATNTSNEVYDVYEKQKKRILEGKNSRVKGEEIDLFSKYYIAVVKDQKISILKTIPVQLDTIERKEVDSKLVQKSMEKRNQLGEAFGTKKRKQQIRQQELNEIKVNTLDDVKQMSARIEQSSLPRQKELDEQIMKDRLIPPCNVNAATPVQVYNIDDICPPHLLELIDIKPLWKARSLKECLDHLKGLQLGQFTKDKIQETLLEKKDKNRLKQLIFLGYLFRFYQLSPFKLNAEDVAQNHMNNCPALILEHLQTHFLQVKESDGEKQYFELTRFIRSDQNKDKLLAYGLCLCLMVNTYFFDMAQIASDLNVSVTKITSISKELGCRTSTKKEKKAMLQLPLQFPKKSRY